jgi:hypothetical protein
MAWLGSRPPAPVKSVHSPSSPRTLPALRSPTTLDPQTALGKWSQGQQPIH